MVQRSNEAVTLASERLDKARFVGRVAQGRPKSFNRSIQAVFEVHIRVGRPEPFLQFLTCDYFTGMLDEQLQHIDRLAIQLDPQPVLAQLACSEIEFESRKAGNPPGDA
jgi:hypothetical protein